MEGLILIITIISLFGVFTILVFLFCKFLFLCSNKINLESDSESDSESESESIEEINSDDTINTHVTTSNSSQSSNQINIINPLLRRNISRESNSSNRNTVIMPIQSSQNYTLPIILRNRQRRRNRISRAYPPLPPISIPPPPPPIRIPPPPPPISIPPPPPPIRIHPPLNINPPSSTITRQNRTSVYVINENTSPTNSIDSYESNNKENIISSNEMNFSIYQYSGNDNCSVCLETMKNQEIINLGCLHKFHYDCIINWWNVDIDKTSCPICRTKNYI